MCLISDRVGFVPSGFTWDHILWVLQVHAKLHGHTRAPSFAPPLTGQRFAAASGRGLTVLTVHPSRRLLARRRAETWDWPTWSFGAWRLSSSLVWHSSMARPRAPARGSGCAPCGLLTQAAPHNWGCTPNALRLDRRWHGARMDRSSTSQ
jgi:hypothetical protein